MNRARSRPKTIAKRSGETPRPRSRPGRDSGWSVSLIPSCLRPSSISPYFGRSPRRPPTSRATAAASRRVAGARILAARFFPLLRRIRACRGGARVAVFLRLLADRAAVSHEAGRRRKTRGIPRPRFCGGGRKTSHVRPLTLASAAPARSEQQRRQLLSPRTNSCLVFHTCGGDRARADPARADLRPREPQAKGRSRIVNSLRTTAGVLRASQVQPSAYSPRPASLSSAPIVLSLSPRHVLRKIAGRWRGPVVCVDRRNRPVPSISGAEPWFGWRAPSRPGFARRSGRAVSTSQGAPILAQACLQRWDFCLPVDVGCMTANPSQPAPKLYPLDKTSPQ